MACSTWVVNAIVVSPDFGEDTTCFAASDHAVFMSVNGGSGVAGAICADAGRAVHPRWLSPRPRGAQRFTPARRAAACGPLALHTKPGSRSKQCARARSTLCCPAGQQQPQGCMPPRVGAGTKPQTSPTWCAWRCSTTARWSPARPGAARGMQRLSGDGVWDEWAAGRRVTSALAARDASSRCAPLFLRGLPVPRGRFWRGVSRPCGEMRPVPLRLMSAAPLISVRMPTRATPNCCVSALCDERIFS
ncbi:MAG: hypothetical protein KatS3mg052_1010 [Candidatus Roseilinea sp.]|nr:MAG: hypothetical protein KatS3mg052_1010 [Candidatus Roseilinea sp.]